MIGLQILAWWTAISLAAGLTHCATVEVQRLRNRARARRTARELAALTAQKPPPTPHHLRRHPALTTKEKPTVTRELPHDPYIEAITAALDKAGPEVKDARTGDCETRGTYCYLDAVIGLDMLSVGLQEEWPHGLLLIWEWHTGIEAEHGEPARGPQWQFAELNEDGSNEYPTDLPVQGYASPAAVVEAARKVIDQSIGAGHFFNFGQPKWDGGIIGDSWERADELDAACEAWAADETAA